MPEGGLSASRGDATGHPASPVHRPDDLDSLILALDFPSSAAAFSFLDRLPRARPRWVKVGLELYLSAGSAIVPALKARGHKVFLDLKLHDIPHTVAGAVRAARALDVDFLTVHLSGGTAMLRAAAGEAGGNLRLLGVSVLTSSDEETLRETGVTDGVTDQVLRLASLGTASGLRGVVASPWEIGALRARCGQELTIVVPGVRPSFTAGSPDDQRRVMTPREAVDAGADYLVIGRPITSRPDPRAAAEQIVREMSAPA